MRGPVDDGSAHRKLMTQPHEIRDAGDAVGLPSGARCRRGLSQRQGTGATMAMDIADMDYGGGRLLRRDLEGPLRSIGAYDPWATHG
jgi:hypothetical protein